MQVQKILTPLPAGELAGVCQALPQRLLRLVPLHLALAAEPLILRLKPRDLFVISGDLFFNRTFQLCECGLFLSIHQRINLR